MNDRCPNNILFSIPDRCPMLLMIVYVCNVCTPLAAAAEAVAVAVAQRNTRVR